MFAFGSALGAPSLFIDTTKERDPPLPPTPLDFPQYYPSDHASKPSNARDSKGLYELLAKLRKPQDVNEDLAQALNLKVETDVKLSEIVPGRELLSLPPYTWPENPTPSETEMEASGHIAQPSSKPLRNGYPAPNKDRYDLLRQELMFENEDGFRAVARAEPRPGREKLRVTHSRNFWASLESVSQYWDCSIDNYFDKPDDEEEDNKEEKDKDAMDIDDNNSTLRESMFGKPTTQDSTDTDRQKPKRVYTGRRIGTGSQMPESMREDTLRGFMEMVAWPFGCQVHIPTLAPRLFVKSLLFPVRHNFSICRSPRDRREARGGLLEGPLLVVQCRGETAFHNKEDAGTNSQYAEICDLLRETLGMLLLAQERAREGASEVKPGEDKWWTTEPRWGGAPNDGPVGDSENNGKDDEKEASNGGTDSDRMAKRSKHSRRLQPPRKLSMAEKWKLVQPGPSMWDRKMRYMAIGKEETSPFDDIFMVSSINHHFSILHLRVHPKYLAWLAAGGDAQSSDAPSSDSEQWWRSLTLRRTRWYDLLNAEDRIEGLDGLWALLSWLMR